MAPPRTLALVLAGGAGSRLELLTAERAKPAVPFGGSYRLIDFPLSNCRHSGVRDVWVAQQQHPASLADALSNGRPWDLDRTIGGLRVLPPGRGTDREGWHHGTADGLWKVARLASSRRRCSSCSARTPSTGATTTRSSPGTSPPERQRRWSRRR